MILVTGATGFLGREIIRQLRGRGAAVAAFVRDEARARTMLGPDVPLVHGHFGDYESVLAAVQGVESLLLYTPTHPNQLVHEMQFVEAASKAKVKHIVKLSAPQGLLTADQRANISTAHAHWQVEEKLRHAPRGSAAYTVLNVNPLLQRFWPRAAHLIAHTGHLALPARVDTLLNLVDGQDVAEAAAVALLDKAHHGRTYALTGPVPLTLTQLATAYGQATGRAITPRHLSPALWRWHVRHEQLTPYALADELAQWAAYEVGAAEAVAPDLGELLGRAPRTVGAYLAEQAAVLAPVLPAPPPTWPKLAAVAAVLLGIIWLRQRRK